jgi:hypothetical protein
MLLGDKGREENCDAQADIAMRCSRICSTRYEGGLSA